MSRIETIIELKELEIAKTNLQNALHDISDYYTKRVSITVQLETEMFPYKMKHDGCPLDVNKVALVGFLKLEIDAMEDKITKLIEVLK